MRKAALTKKALGSSFRTPADPLRCVDGRTICTASQGGIIADEDQALEYLAGILVEAFLKQRKYGNTNRQ